LGGKLIRTVSRLSFDCPGVAPGTRGGKVIRTVSFFGSFGSLIVEIQPGKILLKAFPLSLDKVTRRHVFARGLPRRCYATRS
jgi:hypothetical protein